MQIICLIGPSASGKTSLARMIGAEVVSHTSRSPRPGEKDGVDYYFRSKREMLRMRDSNELVEFNEVYGHLYAVSVEEIERQLARHSRVSLVVELNGLLQVKDSIYGDRVFTVFVHALPEVLLKRMIGRGDNVEDIRKRMARLDEEYKHAAYADAVLYNNSAGLDVAAERLRRILGDAVLKQFLTGGR